MSDTPFPGERPDDNSGDPEVATGSPGEDFDPALAAAGEQVRQSTDPIHPEAIIAAGTKRRMRRAQRLNAVLGTAAAIAVIALVGVSLNNGSSSTGSSAAFATADDEAREIVAGLPDQPVDPLEVELIASVRQFDSCEALLSDLRTVGAAHVGSYGFGGGGAFPYATGALRDAAFGAAEMAGGDRVPGSATSKDSLAGAGAPSGSETLGTNVIVEGVDEPDMVKAGSGVIVELGGRGIRLIDTQASAVVGQLDLNTEEGGPEEGGDTSFGGANSDSMLLDGNSLVVFGNETRIPKPLEGDPSAATPPVSYLTVTFIDISDPANPQVTDDVRIEGLLVAARAVDGQVRVVTSSSLADLPIVNPTTPNAVAPALEQNRLAVASSEVSDWVPEWDRGEGTEATPLVPCEDVVVPDTFAGVQMTSMVEFSAKGSFQPRAMGLLAPSSDITAGVEDVVIGSQIWVDPAKRASDFSDWSTALHHFAFTEEGPGYVASGAVEGSIRDEFSMSVLEDKTIGVVTTEVLPWEPEQKELADVTLRMLRSATGSSELNEIATMVPDSEGVQVAGLRFLGDRLLVSTGLAGNRMSVVDLSDPANPVGLGAVDLPGTGGYFHPLDNERVLVLGDTLRGRGEDIVSGTHASLVDIAGAPRVVNTWQRDEVSTNAIYDHHGFTWWASRSTAAFPLSYHTVETRPGAMFLAVVGDNLVPREVTPTEADFGPRCALDEPNPFTCDSTGAAMVDRILVVSGAPWLHTSESVEQLNPDSLGSVSVVALRPMF